MSSNVDNPQKKKPSSFMLKLDMLAQTIFNYDWLKKNIWGFLSKDKTRIQLMVLIIILHLLVYRNTPQRHSGETAFTIPKYNLKKGWIKHNVQNTTKYYLIYSFILFLDVCFFFYILFNLNKLSKKMLIIPVLIFIVLYNIRISTKTVIEMESYIPAPSYIPIKKNRVRLHLILLVLYIIQFLTEFVLTFKPTTITSLMDLVISRFGSFEKGNILKKIAWVFGWSRFLGLILEVIAFNTTKYFAGCKYNLPNSWHF